MQLRPPQPAAYLFVLDVSHNAVESGYLKYLCESLLDNLDRWELLRALAHTHTHTEERNTGLTTEGVSCVSGYLETHAPRWASSPSTTPSTSTTCRRSCPSRRCWWCLTSTVRQTLRPPRLSFACMAVQRQESLCVLFPLSPLDVFIPSHDSLMVNLKESKEVTSKHQSHFSNVPEPPGHRATVTRSV